ncbi:Ras-related protein [Takifugu flavidus]|uniref:Ras-related protein n=1 Tax=Takifugu flavidus TaxID=433684 RepID=A0A5C6NSS0_9TELE|nr:Ras-related protein [Takifugu flavidus]
MKEVERQSGGGGGERRGEERRGGERGGEERRGEGEGRRGGGGEEEEGRGEEEGRVGEERRRGEGRRGGGRGGGRGEEKRRGDYISTIFASSTHSLTFQMSKVFLAESRQGQTSDQANPKNKVLTIDGVKVKLQIWDTAGQERFRSVTHAYYRDAHALLLLYDVTNKASFDNIQKLLGGRLDVESPSVPSGPFVFVTVATRRRRSPDSDGGPRSQLQNLRAAESESVP